MNLINHNNPRLLLLNQHGYFLLLTLLLCVNCSFIAFVNAASLLTYPADFLNPPSHTNYIVNDNAKLFPKNPPVTDGTWETDPFTRTGSTAPFTYTQSFVNLTVYFNSRFDIEKYELKWFSECTSTNYTVYNLFNPSQTSNVLDANTLAPFSNLTHSFTNSRGLVFLFPLSTANYFGACGAFFSPTERLSNFKIDKLLIYGTNLDPVTFTPTSTAVPISSTPTSTAVATSTALIEEQHTDSSSNPIFIGIGVAGGTCVLLLLVLVLYIIRKKRLEKLRATRHDSNAGSSLELKDSFSSAKGGLSNPGSTHSQHKGSVQYDEPKQPKGSVQYDEPKQGVIVSTTIYSESAPQAPPPRPQKRSDGDYANSNYSQLRGNGGNGASTNYDNIQPKHPSGLQYADLSIHEQAGYDRLNKKQPVVYANPSSSQYADVAAKNQSGSG